MQRICLGTCDPNYLKGATFTICHVCCEGVVPIEVQMRRVAKLQGPLNNFHNAMRCVERACNSKRVAVPVLHDGSQVEDACRVLHGNAHDVFCTFTLGVIIDRVHRDSDRLEGMAGATRKSKFDSATDIGVGIQDRCQRPRTSPNSPAPW